MVPPLTRSFEKFVDEHNCVSQIGLCDILIASCLCFDDDIALIWVLLFWSSFFLFCICVWCKFVFSSMCLIICLFVVFVCLFAVAAVVVIIVVNKQKGNQINISVESPCMKSKHQTSFVWWWNHANQRCGSLTEKHPAPSKKKRKKKEMKLLQLFWLTNWSYEVHHVFQDILQFEADDCILQCVRHEQELRFWWIEHQWQQPMLWFQFQHWYRYQFHQISISINNTLPNRRSDFQAFHPIGVTQ